MKIKFSKFFLIIYLAFLNACQSSQAITLVYSLRIRRSFSFGNALDILNTENKSLWITSIVPAFYTRSRNITNSNLGINVFEKRIAGGSILNLRYIPSESWWLEATTGIAKERVYSKGTLCFTDSRTGFDDIIIAGGHNMLLEKDTQLALYGLAGFPTYRKVNKLESQGTLLGTRFFSLGIGWELSHSFANTLEKSFIVIFQNRFLHFFNRKWYPILPPDAKIQPGNVTDLLFAARYRKGKNILEAGYNPTFFTNQAIILKTGKQKSESLIRKSIYASFSHIYPKIPIFEKPTLLEAGFNIGRAKMFKTKIFTCWLNISMVF